MVVLTVYFLQLKEEDELVREEAGERRGREQRRILCTVYRGEVKKMYKSAHLL